MEQARALESPLQDHPKSRRAAQRTRLHLKPDDSSKPPLHLPTQKQEEGAG